MQSGACYKLIRVRATYCIASIYCTTCVRAMCEAGERLRNNVANLSFLQGGKALQGSVAGCKRERACGPLATADAWFASAARWSKGMDGGIAKNSRGLERCGVRFGPFAVHARAKLRGYAVIKRGHARLAARFRALDGFHAAATHLARSGRRFPRGTRSSLALHAARRFALPPLHSDTRICAQS